MLRALEECNNVAADFRADPVHDLRVSLRRCRSLADGMMAMDPDRDWKEMKKAGRQLFQRLGDLRDVQIMMDWIEKLDFGGRPSSEDQTVRENDQQAPGSPAGTSAELQPSDPPQSLMRILGARETQHKHEARAALEEFDRKQWLKWSKTLPARAARVRPGSAVFKHLALERWVAARELHTRAMRNRSQVAFHTLRIGIKRFRYIVENFLPEQHKLWGNDLKHMQDLLGEVHDLDVLWATALSCRVFGDDASRKRWHGRILEERSKRIEEYRGKSSGSDSLWNQWRAGLPQGKEIQEIATRRLKLWAKALDPDFAHSERVARLALELYDGVSSLGLFRGHEGVEQNGSGNEARAGLYLAALLHDVGMSKGKKGHHKESLELIKKHGIPLGWKAEDMTRAGLVARFHCGALPMRSHKALRDLLADEQKTIVRLSAILRLANALDAEHNGQIRKVQIENGIGTVRRADGFLRKPPALAKNEPLLVAAEGYVDGTATAQAVAADRYLLETVLRRPVMVKAARGPGPSISRSRATISR